MKLPLEPREFGPCPKCGWVGVDVAWEADIARCFEDKREGFEVECLRCGYAWAEDVDSEPLFVPSFRIEDAP